VHMKLRNFAHFELGTVYAYVCMARRLAFGLIRFPVKKGRGGIAH